MHELQYSVFLQNLQSISNYWKNRQTRASVLFSLWSPSCFLSSIFPLLLKNFNDSTDPLNLQRERRKQSLPDAAYKTLVTTFSSSCPNKRAHNRKDRQCFDCFDWSIRVVPLFFFFPRSHLIIFFLLSNSLILETVDVPSDESRKQSDNEIYREETTVVIESDSDSNFFLLHFQFKKKTWKK